MTLFFLVAFKFVEWYGFERCFFVRQISNSRSNYALNIIHPPLLNPSYRLIPISTHVRLSLSRSIQYRLRAF